MPHSINSGMITSDTIPWVLSYSPAIVNRSKGSVDGTTVQMTQEPPCNLSSMINSLF